MPPLPQAKRDKPDIVLMQVADSAKGCAKELRQDGQRGALVGVSLSFFRTDILSSQHRLSRLNSPWTGYIGYPFEKTAFEERRSRCQICSL
jgi:hypothetical protein